MSWSKKPAEAGQPVAMLGGDPDTVAEIRPLLDPLCRETVYCGPVGHGMVMEPAVNLYLDTRLAGLAEVVHVADRYGLGLDTFRAVVDAGPPVGDLTRVQSPMLVARDFSVQAATSDAFADTRLIANAARAAGISAPLLDRTASCTARAWPSATDGWTWCRSSGPSRRGPRRSAGRPALRSRPLAVGVTSPYGRGRVCAAGGRRARGGARSPATVPRAPPRCGRYPVSGPGGAATDAEERDAAFADTVRRTGASIGALYLLAPDEQVLCLDVLSGVPADFAAPWVRVPLAAPMPVAVAVREDRMVWVGSQEEMSRAYPRTAMVVPYPLALVAAPVTGVQRWGVLMLMWPATRPPYMTARERGNIAASCRRLARLLEEAAEHGRLPSPADGPRVVLTGTDRRPVSPTMAVADFVERLPGGSCALDLEGRFTFVSSGACDLLGRDADQLLGTVPWQSLRWLDDPVYEDRYRGAVISREPVAFTACRPPDHWLDIHLYPDASGISVRIVPCGGQPPPAPAPRNPARPAALARAGRLYQLMHLAAGLTEVVGVQDVIDLVADQIMPAFGAQGMVLSAADAGRLRITGYRGYAADVIERLDGLPLDTGLTPAGQAIAGGIPAFFGDPDEMRRIYPQAPLMSDKQAWAFLPLIVSGRPVGICILSYDRPHTFPAEERAVMTSLAGLVAQALDRARLYDLKHELAHGLQQALLPRSLPTIAELRVAARYLPATRGMDIGGDFYDLIRLGDTAAAAVIGDVQGHNVAAAALMGQVRSGVLVHATLGTSPDQVLARTNRLLVDLAPDLFTSCLYAHLDFAHRRVTLAGAGHPPPLRRLPDGDTRPVELAPGPLLGIDPDAVFPVTEMPLTPGLTLAFYTDGLIERPGVDVDEAIDGLARHLADADDRDLDALVDALLRQAGPDGRRTDDTALLVLQHRPAGDGERHPGE
nr:SpoIIE family protein phosphatase [Streptomyces chromofuscus]